MQISFAPAFLRQVEKLDPPLKRAVKSATADVIDFYESRLASPGLGVKRLRGGGKREQGGEREVDHDHRHITTKTRAKERGTRPAR